jgi:integrase
VIPASTRARATETAGSDSSFHVSEIKQPLALALAESTGQRIGSILRVRRCDIDLDRLPHGRILFRAESQKTGFEHRIPLSEECRQHLLAHLRRVRSEPDAWLFPAERSPRDAVSVWVISTSPRRAYQRAGLETLKGGLWHPWRRKWATERKDMPVKDVAAAGGWRDPTTLLKCYQQPDEETMRRVVLEAPKLLSRPVRRLEVTPNATPSRKSDDGVGHRNVV